MALHAELRATLGPDAALDVTLDVAHGECLALAGVSGAGKTSVLRAIAGLVRPDHGVVRCGDAVWTNTSAGVFLAPEHRRCGVVFQDHALFAHLSAWRNVAFPLRGLPRDERRRRALALLDRLGLAARAEARPATLSGGERQRVALARALALDPAVLLLDEPLASLDTRTRREASAVIAEVLGEVGVPAILVTHDFTEAAHLADRVAVLDGGRIVQTGTPSALAAAPATAFVADLTGAVVLHGQARPGPEGLTEVVLAGGGVVLSTEPASGLVAVAVHPWEIALEPAGSPSGASGRNRLPARVRSVTELGNRARVALAVPESVVAEVTLQAAHELRLAPGSEVVAAFKATATRVVGATEVASR